MPWGFQKIVLFEACCLCSMAAALVYVFLVQANNNLGPDGAVVLAGALEKMTGLRKLNLVSKSGGGAGEGSAEALAKSSIYT